MTRTVIAENTTRRLGAYGGLPKKKDFLLSKEMDDSTVADVTLSMKNMLGDKSSVAVRVAAC